MEKPKEIEGFGLSRVFSTFEAEAKLDPFQALETKLTDARAEDPSPLDLSTEILRPLATEQKILPDPLDELTTPPLGEMELRSPLELPPNTLSMLEMEARPPLELPPDTLPMLEMETGSKSDLLEDLTQIPLVDGEERPPLELPDILLEVEDEIAQINSISIGSLNDTSAEGQ